MTGRMFRFGFSFLAMAVFASAIVWAGGGKDALKSKNYVIGSWWTEYDVNTAKPTDEEGELQLERRKKMLSDHQFTMSEKIVSGFDGYLDVIITSIMAGNPVSNAFWLSGAHAVTLYKQGLLAPLSDSKAVDMSTSTFIPYQQVAYNQEIAQIFTFAGKQYALGIGYGDSQQTNGVFYNKRLFREAGLDQDLPYDMQKAGTWTWDNYLDICKRLTRDRNNTGRVDTWAMPMDIAQEILDALVFSNGAAFVTKDAAGNFHNASGTPEFLEALQFARRLQTEGVMMPRPEGSTAWDWHFGAFQEGRVAMTIDPSWRTWNASPEQMVDVWGFVAVPKGPRARDYFFGNNENVLGIPSTYTSAEVDNILTAINMWYISVAANWKDVMYLACRDARSVDETHAMIRTPGHTVFRMHNLIPTLNVGEIAWNMWGWDGDPAQLIEQASQTWNAAINDVNSMGRNR